MRSFTTAVAVAFLLAPVPVLAHQGSSGVSTGISAGFSHPMGGVDHLLAMVGIGIFASLFARRSALAVSLSFNVMAAAGIVVGRSGMVVPGAEWAIAGSVVLLGMLISGGRDIRLEAACILTGAFGIFHGYAHGMEGPTGSGILGYVVGFLAATILLQVIGAGLGLLSRSQDRARRWAGAGMAIAGLGVLLS